MEESLDQHLSLLSQKYSSTLNQLQNLKQAKQEAEQKAEELEEQLKEELSAHENDLKQAQQDIDYLTRANSQLRKSLDSMKELQSNLHQKDGEYSSLLSQYKQVLERSSQDKQKASELETKNQQLQEELDSALQQLESMKKYQAALEKAKQKAIADSAAIKKQTMEFQEKAYKREKELEKLLNETKNKEEDNKARQNEYRSLLKKNSSLTKENQELTANSKKLQEELKVKSERLATVRSHKAKVESMLKQEEKDKQELQIKITQLEKTVDLYGKLSKTQPESNNIGLDIKLSESEKKLQELIKKINPLIEKNKKLEEVVEKQNKEIESLKKKPKIQFTERSDNSKSSTEHLEYGEVYNNAAVVSSRRGKHIVSPLISERSGYDFSPVKLDPQKVYAENFLNSTNEFHSNVIFSPEYRQVTDSLQLES